MLRSKTIPSIASASRPGDGVRTTIACTRYYEELKKKMDRTIHVTREQQCNLFLEGIEGMVLKKVGNSMFLTQGFFFTTPAGAN
jgi:hypothetical protein